MVVLIGILLGLLGLLGGHGPDSGPEITPSPAGASFHVIARACPAGTTADEASADRCPIWPDGAAIQATDLKGNAWGMNASRDSSLPGNPVIYTLDNLPFGTYVLGAPSLPAGYDGFVIAGAQTSAGGAPRVVLTSEHPRAELTAYFLKSA